MRRSRTVPGQSALQINNQRSHSIKSNVLHKDTVDNIVVHIGPAGGEREEDNVLLGVSRIAATLVDTNWKRASSSSDPQIVGGISSKSNKEGFISLLFYIYIYFFPFFLS